MITLLLIIIIIKLFNSIVFVQYCYSVLLLLLLLVLLYDYYSMTGFKTLIIFRLCATTKERRNNAGMRLSDGD